MTMTQNGVLQKDDNGYPVMGGTSSVDDSTIVNSALDPVTRRLLTDMAGGGTVTSVSIVSANGFAGTVATSTTTPAITLSTTITGILKGNGTAISAASDGTDYLSSTTGVTLAQGTAQTIGTTTNRVLKIWATDLTVTNTITGSISGNSATATTAPTTAILVSQASPQTIGATGTRLTKLWATDIESTNAPTVGGVAVPTISSTNTLTNKRITPRVSSATSYTTDTGTSLNADNFDMFSVTAQAGDLKFNNPGGTPTDGQKLIITVASSTTAARALTWDTSYEASTVALPTTTAATTAQLNIGFLYSGSRTKWVCVAVA